MKFEDLEEILKKVEKPSRYINGEWNAIRKDPLKVKTKIALVFPDTYEIGMSYLGLKILYSILNEKEDILAERVFAPWIDFERELRKRNFSLFSLENRIPLKEFDIIGFSLLYELNYTNVLTILDLGKIPLKSLDRDLSYPLIIAGGPSVFNPEPMAEFFDLFFIGDGEEGFLEIIDKFNSLKGKVKNKLELLKHLSQIKGVYVPAFYETYQQENFPLLAVRPKNSFPERIAKRVIRDLDKHPFPNRVIVPLTEAVFDRITLEISRGCPQRCRFCQAASIYLPYRMRSPENVIDCAIRSVNETGFESISLTTLSPTDYPYLEETIKILMDNISDKKIALSLSAIRPSGLSEEIIQNIKKVRKTGFTIAPEAGSERLRRVINKNLEEDEIILAAEKAFSYGWRVLKLYFMVGLPTEKEEDLKEIVTLVEKISNVGWAILDGYPKIHLSLTSFIPKPHTPFQWLPMEDEEVLKEKIKFIKSCLKRYPWVRFKDHPVEMSVIEAVISRGDRRLNGVIETAWKKGSRFDSWRDLFNEKIWFEAFSENGIDYKVYLSKFSEKSILPWEHIETGFKKEYLLKELEMGLKGEQTASCLNNDCVSCLGCIYPLKFKEKIYENIEPIGLEKVDYIGKKEEKSKLYRCEYTKTGKAKYLSHLDLIRIIERGFRRANIPVNFSKGFHPKMLISYCPALPLGMEGKREILEFNTDYSFNEDEFLDRINKFFPEGIRFLSIKEISSENRMANSLKGFLYSLKINDELISALYKVKEERNWRGLSITNIHKKLAQIIKSEINLIDEIIIDEDKVFFYVIYKKERPLKIQELIKKYYLIENPIFLITREKIFL
ncbi:TIGR03960 family B12-binding radical SAM protein [SCandidatus Aminicenantes bacterium Aminicenantia_JdfR_composite]|nr:TIGR03960 family B12-binding radical SAM protein [SCandidatus Aminicenantes bacterium Aminicenantia_JdfR_composite]